MPHRPEHAFANLLELQVGFHLAFVEIVFRLAHLLGIEAIVPWRDPDPGALGVSDLLHIGDFLAHARREGRPHLQQQVHDGVGGFRHLIVGDPVGECGIAEQLCFLGAQLQDFGDGDVVVMRVAIVAARGPHAERLFAQIAADGIGEERLDRRTGVGEQELAFQFLVLGSGRRRSAQPIR